MEFELDFSRKWNLTVWAPIILIIVTGLGVLGRVVTPEGDLVLTWTEWRILRAKQAYRGELVAMQKEVEILTGLLNQSPDVVRAQLAAEQVERNTEEGQPSLSAQREAVFQAALIVRDWAAGAADKNTAQDALQTAIQALEGADAR